MSAVLQVLLHIADQKLGVQEAIEAPRLHCEVAPNLVLDSRFPPTVQRSLRRRGFATTQKKETFLSAYFARPSGILVDREKRALHGGTEPYRSGAVAGL
jgi:gamma-glutamyltranspeptidase/glutathione hydrolase